MTDHNESKCTACGNPGELVCCDACPASLHYACCDPPLTRDTVPDGEWLCRRCNYEHHPRTIPPRTSKFAPLVKKVMASNPKVFSLPQQLFSEVKEIRAQQREKGCVDACLLLKCCRTRVTSSQRSGVATCKRN